MIIYVRLISLHIFMPAYPQLVVWHYHLQFYIYSSDQRWKLAVVSVCISGSNFQHMSVCGQTEIWVSMQGSSAAWLAVQQIPAPFLAGGVPIWRQLRAAPWAAIQSDAYNHSSSPSESGSSRGPYKVRVRLIVPKLLQLFKGLEIALSLALCWDKCALGDPTSSS